MLRAGTDAGRCARARGADLLHGHGLRFAPLWAAASLAARRPLVVTLHNLVPPDLPLAARAALRAALLCARQIIAVSAAVARSARTVAPAGRVAVVRSGVDVAAFAPGTPDERAAARAALGLAGCQPAVLCVARLSPEKNVGGFLEAAAIAARRAPGARFLVAGGGPLGPTLRYQIECLDLSGQARLLGRRDDVPRLLAAVDVLCLPSREEGLGLAVLEAMAAGLPVVATNVGGVPEVVAAGETGLLVPPGDPAALAAALAALLTAPDRARAMGAAGRARAAERFTLRHMVAATHAVYARALAP
jgi:glycosyltransferase involved in cell wall biosynthesis